MKKKKIIIIGVLVAIIVALISYPLIRGAIIKKKTYEYLNTKECYSKQIESIKVKHSYLNLILNYDEWNIEVKFHIDNNVKYDFTYKNKEIIFRGINDSENEKDYIQQKEDKFNNGELCSPPEGTNIDTKIIEPMKSTSKILIKGYSSFYIDEPELIIKGTITDKKVIDEIVEIMSELIVPTGEYFNCDGNAHYLEMYNADGKLIDTIFVWDKNQAAAIPKSVHSGCTKMSLITKNANELHSIITQNSN